MSTCLAFSASGGVRPSDPAWSPPYRPLIPRIPRIHKVQVLSDLHFDVMPCPAPILAAGADAVVVAGGTCAGAEKAFAYLRAAFPSPIPLVMVLGNEEFHERSMVDELPRARRLAFDYEVTLLENASTEMGGVRFVGATLWTGYDLDGPGGQAAAMAAAMRDMDDHRRILLSRTPWRRFLPKHALERFEDSSAYIDQALRRPFDGPTVVVTHHAPSATSLDPALGRDRLNNAFASRLDWLSKTGAPHSGSMVIPSTPVTMSWGERGLSQTHKATAEIISHSNPPS